MADRKMADRKMADRKMADRKMADPIFLSYIFLSYIFLSYIFLSYIFLSYIFLSYIFLSAGTGGLNDDQVPQSAIRNQAVVDFNPVSRHYRLPLFRAIISARINSPPSKRRYDTRESGVDGYAQSTRR